MRQKRRSRSLIVGILAAVSMIVNACAGPGATPAPATATIAPPPSAAAAAPATVTPPPATPVAATPTQTPPSPTPRVATSTPAAPAAAQRSGLTCIAMQWSGEATVEVNASTDPAATPQVKVSTPTAAPATPTPSQSADDSGICSESAPMPSGAVPYSLARPVKVGDVVQHPSGLVVQVTGVRTVSVDAQSELVLVDLVAGNAGKEKQYIYPFFGMEIVGGDWRWFTSIDESAGPKLAEQNITWTFGAVLEPGQAAKGRAVFQVPTSAKQLAFAIQSFGPSFRVNSPSVFVSLGLRGDFPPPAIPEDVAALKSGTIYQVGQAFKAPKRGVAFQVNRVWQRLERAGSIELKSDEQFVLVDVTAQVDSGAPLLDPAREVTLVDSKGVAFKPVNWHGLDVVDVQNAEGTVPLVSESRPYNQRGVLAFVGPLSATGLSLRFAPLDPATMTGSSPKPLAAEAVTIKPSAIEGPSTTAKPTATAKAKPTSTAAPRAGATPAAARQTPGTASSLPNELQGIPVPAGFSPVAGSSQRKIRGDVFRSVASWSGPTNCLEISNFYNQALARGWTLNGGTVGDSNLEIGFTQDDTDPEVALDVTAEIRNGQTILTLTIANGQP